MRTRWRAGGTRAMALQVAMLAVFAVLLTLPRVACESACPVVLLDITSKDDEGTEGLHLTDHGLKYLAGLRSPLYVVPVLGVYRGGKSMLLNRLRGLQSPYKNGFGVGHGQHTFTRGIAVCAEDVADLGTVIWMDTEGLFSYEDARSAYGPKIFSLALLFSSTVLLNSIKVFNDQFFAFFGQQQQVARVLKQGLAAHGLPSEGLLPGNLSVHWVLQQPLHFDSTGKTSRAQLEAFLQVRGDQTRDRVRRGFTHLVHEIPAASHDYRAWARLDKVPDEELVPEYVIATSELRELVLQELRQARPLHAGSVAKQLEMYVQTVETERFSGAMAKEVFEQNEIGTLCSNFSRAAAEFAGPLPSSRLEEAFAVARQGIEEKQAEVVETFHFGTDWSERLEKCLQDQVAATHRRNAEIVLELWQANASAVAEGTGCFFLGALVRLLKEYESTYGIAFGPEVRAQAVEYASALQRARLVECVRLWDFLWPILPWLAWPVCSYYLRSGLLSGMMSMALHTVILVGVYVMMQFFNRLPGYLDVNYPVLRNHPLMLRVVMLAPPLVPWNFFAHLLGVTGTLFSAWRVAQDLWYYSRPPGHGYTTDQMLVLEMKLNMQLKRTEADIKHKLNGAALDVARYLASGNALAASFSLLHGLRLVQDLGSEIETFSGDVNADLWERLQAMVRTFQPAAGGTAGSELCQSFCDIDFVSAVKSGDCLEVIEELVSLAERMSKLEGWSSTGSPRRAAPSCRAAARPKARLAARLFGQRGGAQDSASSARDEGTGEIADPAKDLSPILASCSSPESEPDNEDEPSPGKERTMQVNQLRPQSGDLEHSEDEGDASSLLDDGDEEETVCGSCGCCGKGTGPRLGAWAVCYISLVVGLLTFGSSGNSAMAN
mmetsp:Transcript_138004/g.251133  ORF Transcript_138004/g.251133 Transcript_138004/m.251133 type:complete len:888 (-) Transcript_138004:95-2758(-)